MSNETFVKNLRDQGFRVTPQRIAILQILEQSRGHLSASAIYEQAIQRMPGMTEATVYRTLDFLAHHGLALVTHVDDGRLVYEAAGHSHHHLVCRACGYSVEIEHDLLEEVYAGFRERTGFQIDTIHVTFFGLCPGCAPKQ